MSQHISPYHAPGFIPDALARGKHRDIIGGRWDETGIIQMQMLLAEGLKPQHRLLDVGCGPLRTGCRLVPYLNPGNYWGTDLSGDLMRQGYRQELTEGDRARLPRSQLVEDRDFSFPGIPDTFDYLLCFAVFTHLPLNHLRRCLHNLAPHMAKGGRFFATYFECLDGQDLFAPLAQPRGGIVTYDYQDPYHYRLGDLAWTVDPTQWAFEPIGEWDHPRGQRMACFRRL